VCSSDLALVHARTRTPRSHARHAPFLTARLLLRAQISTRAGEAPAPPAAKRTAPAPPKKTSSPAPEAETAAAEVTAATAAAAAAEGVDY
jgi:hypothetical protein